MSSDQVNDNTGTASSLEPEGGYPEQKHAGAVGYGPNYQRGVGMDEKWLGAKEELKGKVLRKPELVEHGRDRRTGELKRREQETDQGSPFDKEKEEAAKTEAATTAPEAGAAQAQKEGDMKHIG